MHFYTILIFLAATLFLALLRSIRRLCIVEAAERSGADLLMDGENVGWSSTVIAVLRGRISIGLSQELDTDVSITWLAYRAADTSHTPLTEDWEEVRDIALSSTRQLLECRDPDEDTPLRLFIRSVVLSTLLRLFFRLPTTSANTEEVMWIADKARWTNGRHQISPELSRLLKSSQNPSGVIALLSTIERVTLAAICTLETGDEKLRFLRRAGTHLRDPNSPQPGVIRLVEKVKKCNPPVQSVHGGVLLGSFPLCGTSEVDFFVPVDLIPPSPCIIGSDGACYSWLHKAGLPGRPECGGEEWLIQTTAIILSSIETEMRRSHLTIDGDEHKPEEWEEWTVRRLRV